MEDDRENPIQITLWPEKCDLIGNETIPGDILAITSTLVTDFQGSKQLESTNATTIVVNPTFPEIQHHVDRYSILPIVGISIPRQTLLYRLLMLILG
uniref:Putative nucleic acid-binding, OB-fold protein n=1 Tax=Helianthus annuus TaxID=4232 RepID=A0A251V4L6_HELAN